MSWLKENLFGVALGGTTAVVAGGLLYWGFSGSSRVTVATERFMAAADEVTSLQRSPLAPSAANKDGKAKALADYRASIAGLQSKFLAYRPKEIIDIPPAEFGTKLLEITGKGRKALESAGVKVPPNALGLEQYTSKPAEQGATGILSYQVSAIASLAQMLAEARPSTIVNIHRPPLPEESKGKYTPAENEIARALPLEITFRGSEKALRTFLEKLVNDQSHFFVVRSLRVTNQNKKGPTADEAKFEAPKTTPAASDNPFGGADDGGFVLPPDPAEGEKPASGARPAPGAATPAPGAANPAPGAATPAPGTGAAEAPAVEAPPAPAPPPPPAASKSSRQILKQLVGNEEITVWMRIDILLFHDKVELPGSEPKKR